MRVVVLRATPDAVGTGARLRALGHDAVLAPVTAYAPTGRPPPTGDFAALLLTSAAAAPCCAALRKDRPVFAVGARTADAARAAGFADVREGAGAAADLVRAVSAVVPAGAELLHAAGRDRKAEPGRSLSGEGFRVTVWECYAAEALPALPMSLAPDLAAVPAAAALHYSRRSAALAAALFDAAGLAETFAGLAHLCLSADVATALPGLRVLVADEPTEAALLARLADVQPPPPGSPPRSR